MEERTYYNLTNPQKSIWMIEQFYQNSNINCMGGSIRIYEKVDFDLLIKAYNLFLEKNDGLRLRVVEKDGEPMQYIANYVYENVEIIDITKKEFEEKMKHYVPKPFKIIDSKLYSKLDEPAKERYLFDLVDKYKRYKEKYEREQSVS